MRRFWVSLVLALASCSEVPDAVKQPAEAALAATPAATPKPMIAVQPGKFDGPMAMAFLPDGRLLVGLKDGTLKLRAPNGSIAAVSGMPAAEMVRDIVVIGDTVWFAFSEPQSAGGYLALGRGVLKGSALTKVQVLWHGKAERMDGSLGGAIAVSPKQDELFISGARQRWGAPALPRGKRPKGYHRPIVAYGSILRIYLPPRKADGTIEARAVLARIATTGHRNPLGLAIASDGRLWEHEMGPKGGDELNLIVPGADYGWPKVSNGDNYDGTVIPDHKPGDGFRPPVLFWKPSISPAGFLLYSGKLFPEWRGSGFMGALSGQALVRVSISGDGAAKGDQWPMQTRIRDVAEAPDGAIWLVEDDTGEGGRLFRMGR